MSKADKQTYSVQKIRTTKGPDMTKEMWAVEKNRLLRDRGYLLRFDRRMSRDGERQSAVGS